MKFPVLSFAILPWLIHTSLAQPDSFYDLDFDDTLYTRGSVRATGYKTNLYKRSAEAMVDLLSDLAESPHLSRREAMNALGGGAELVHASANLISVLSNGCPSRTDADFAECNYCRSQKKQKRSPEPRGGGRGGGGGGKASGGGGGGRKGKMNPGMSGRGDFDCNGWKF